MLFIGDVYSKKTAIITESYELQEYFKLLGLTVADSIESFIGREQAQLYPVIKRYNKFIFIKQLPSYEYSFDVKEVRQGEYVVTSDLYPSNMLHFFSDLFKLMEETECME